MGQWKGWFKMIIIHYDIEVKIIDLKAEVNKAEDTQMPTSEEDD